MSDRIPLGRPKRRRELGKPSLSRTWETEAGQRALDGRAARQDFEPEEPDEPEEPERAEEPRAEEPDEPEEPELEDPLDPLDPLLSVDDELDELSDEDEVPEPDEGLLPSGEDFFA